MFRNRWWPAGFLILAALMLIGGVAHFGSCDDCCTEDNCGDCQVCQCCSVTPSFLPTIVSAQYISTPAESAASFPALISEGALSADLDRPPRLLSV